MLFERRTKWDRLLANARGQEGEIKITHLVIHDSPKTYLEYMEDARFPGRWWSSLGPISTSWTATPAEVGFR